MPAEDATRRWQQRLALPVAVAAVASVPAVFLTMAPDPRWSVTGRVLNWASLSVFAVESLLLLALSHNRRTWIRQHRWHLLITLVAVPAVALAVFPAQALRLVHLARLVGALRVRRAGRIAKAGWILASRFGLSGGWRYLLVGVGTALAAVFVIVVLVDPTASERRRSLLNEITEGGLPLALLTVLAGVLVATATFIVVRHRNHHRSESGSARSRPRPRASDDPPCTTPDGTGSRSRP